MAAARRRNGNSSSESSDEAMSSDDDVPSSKVTASTTNKKLELTLKDDENTIDLQAPLPEDDGKNKHELVLFFALKSEIRFDLRFLLQKNRANPTTIDAFSPERSNRPHRERSMMRMIIENRIHRKRNEKGDR